jgi:G:T/U-mismatch repair DNA glycosylase
MADFELTYSYEPFIDDVTERLVIGTLRTSDECSFDFFYSGKNNMFWKILSKAYNYKFPFPIGEKAVTCRKEFLREKKIGFIDMHHTCYRRRGSAKDTDLFSVKLTDMFGVFDKYPRINTLIFTSRTTAVGALGLFNIYLLQQGVEMVATTRCRDGLLVGTFHYHDRKFLVRVPYSPSKSSKISRTLGVDGLAPMYKECFIN